MTREQDLENNLRKLIEAAELWGLELDKNGLAGIAKGSVGKCAGGKRYVDATIALATTALEAREAFYGERVWTTGRSSGGAPRTGT